MKYMLIYLRKYSPSILSRTLEVAVLLRALPSFQRAFEILCVYLMLAPQVLSQARLDAAADCSMMNLLYKPDRRSDRCFHLGTYQLSACFKEVY